MLAIRTAENLFFFSLRDVILVAKYSLFGNKDCLIQDESTPICKLEGILGSKSHYWCMAAFRVIWIWIFQSLTMMIGQVTSNAIFVQSR